MQSCKHLCKVFSPSPSPLHTSPPLADLDIILHLQKEMAFSHHEHHLSFMDFALLPGTPAEMPFLQFYSSEDNNSHLPLSDAATLCASNSLDHECLKPPPVVDQAGEKSPRQSYGEKKRKINKDESSLITCQSKEEDKISRQKKPNSGFRVANDKKISSTCEELQAGYIHVRARRGEATDSHSLAERVRREKISERMKVLQSLVPGCEKVTGKALMLDEIINYVQSLQNQVEFLSMKLASFNPMLYFGADLDEYSNQPGRMPRSTPLHVPISAAPTSHLENLAFEDGTGNCQMMGQWAHFALQGQGAISFPQDGSSDVYDQQHLLL